jgi:hypothetical protein
MLCVYLIVFSPRLGATHGDFVYTSGFCCTNRHTGASNMPTFLSLRRLLQRAGLPSALGPQNRPNQLHLQMQLSPVKLNRLIVAQFYLQTCGMPLTSSTYNYMGHRLHRLVIHPPTPTPTPTPTPIPTQTPTPTPIPTPTPTPTSNPNQLLRPSPTPNLHRIPTLAQFTPTKHKKDFNYN